MKLANEEILTWVYQQIGNDLTVNGTTWEYYPDPPESGTDRYIWGDITILDESGSKEDFMANYLLEFTIVDKVSRNFTSKKQLYEAASKLSEIIAIRNGQVDLANFEIIARNFQDFTYSKEIEGGEVRHVGKANFIILAEQKS